MMDETKPLSPSAAPETLEAPGLIPRADIAAWLFLALGYFFCCAFPMSKRPLFAVPYITALYAISFLRNECMHSHLIIVCSAS